MNPLDFFYWGYLKQKLYNKKVYLTLDELKSEIIKEVNDIPLEIIKKVVSSVPKRLKYLIESNGEIIKEHIV